MKAEIWGRARKVFEEVVAEPTADRSAVLDQACGADRDLRRAVERLLAADRTEEDLMDEPPAAEILRAVREARDRRWLGRTLGDYRIVRRLGGGGMGSVYLGERADASFSKQVAVKVIRVGFETEWSLRRFRTERQILASLEHPNIARLLDGGTTEEGLPFLVMEFVEGLPITRYCDHHRLPVRERLRLFRQVCSAVQRAHQNLVVHRDLKPSNVLVTREGIPKLLDFGIAKLLDDSLVAGGVAETQTAARVLTPDYASPEQALGDPVTTASDVYSLGLLLYELLTGQRPHRLQGRRLRRAGEARRGAAPMPPSAVVASGGTGDPGSIGAPPEDLAAARLTTPAALRRELAGDLDRIVLRALEGEPERRYGSAEGLSRDLGRYLSGLPVEARAGGAGYRLGKLVRRHAATVAAAVAALALLVGFTAVTAVQSARLAEERDLARREKTRAEAISRFLVEAFAEADPSQSRGDAVTAREILDAGAHRIGRDLAGEPEVQAALLETIAEVYVSLGQLEPAEPLLSRALEIQERLPRSDPSRLAGALHAWGELKLEQGKTEEAEKAALQALAIRRQADPPNASESLHLLGRILRVAGRRQESISVHQEALDRRHRAGTGSSPEYVQGLRWLATAARASGDARWAEELHREALALQWKLVPGDHPITVSLLNDLAISLRERGELEEAERLGDEALAMSRRLYPHGHVSTALALNTLASTLRLQGRIEEALTYYQASLDFRRDLLGPSHPRLPGAIYNLATLLHRDLGRPAAAEPLYREAVEIQRRTLGGDHPNMAFFTLGLGRVLSDLGRSEEAEPLLRRCLEHFEEGGQARNVASARSALAGALLGLGRYDEAEELLLASYPVLAESYGRGHRITRRALIRLVELYRQTGREPAAAGYQALLDASEDQPS